MLPIVRDVTLPTILAGHANGELPDDVLVDVGGGQLLVRDAAWSWIDMRNAAARDGVLLVIDNAYRPYAQQEALFLARYSTDPQYSGRPSSQWNQRTWYLLPGQALAAVPGTSNHGWGLAIDLVTDGDFYERQLPWLTSYAPLWGFSAEVQSEPWHWRYFAGDYTPGDDDVTPQQLATAFGGELDEHGRIMIPLADGGKYPLGNILGFIHSELTVPGLLVNRIAGRLGK